MEEKECEYMESKQLKKMKKTLYILLFFILLVQQVASAQGSDPVLAGMIIDNRKKAEKQYKKEEAAIAALAAQHMYMQKYENHLTELHDSLNAYLSDLHDYVVYAAEGYGFYLEIEGLIKNMEKLSKEVLAAPSNGVAVALCDRRKLYQDLFLKSVGMIKTIKSAYLANKGKTSKMTQEERIRMVLPVRLQLQAFNRDLRRLVIYIKYTSMTDVWFAMTHQSRPRNRDIGAISEDAIRHWRANAHKTK